MRRKEREVAEKSDIIDILNRCNTIRLGMHGEQFPYVIPVSFGLEVISDNPIVYFHCAQQGMKLELLRNNPNVCVEADIFYKVETTEHGITTRYESFIGFGKCTFLTDAYEIQRCLKIINTHYDYQDYPIGLCKGLAHLLIGKITFDTITGKRNIPSNERG